MSMSLLLLICVPKVFLVQRDRSRQAGSRKSSNSDSGIRLRPFGERIINEETSVANNQDQAIPGTYSTTATSSSQFYLDQLRPVNNSVPRGSSETNILTPSLMNEAQPPNRSRSLSEEAAKSIGQTIQIRASYTDAEGSPKGSRYQELPSSQVLQMPRAVLEGVKETSERSCDISERKDVGGEISCEGATTPSVVDSINTPRRIDPAGRWMFVLCQQRMRKASTMCHRLVSLVPVVPQHSWFGWKTYPQSSPTGISAIFRMRSNTPCKMKTFLVVV